ncbi:hypothetical protein V8J88_07400 [Massilia sp. W12]|uniref:hypothetical protein n=1 Tax=Massilia sp. W12 TaxID=3126507 RepID=UPI0030CEF6E0
MPGSSIIDVAIGMMFIYLLFGVLCTALNETLSTLLNKRGKNLLEGIKNMLNDPLFNGLARQLYEHGLITGISRNAISDSKANRPPSYMPPDNFSLALLDLLTSHGLAAAAKSPALLEAEAADEALFAAQAAADTATIEAAKARQQHAETALQTQIENAKHQLAQAQSNARDQANDSHAAQALLAAQNALETAQAAPKLLALRRAALAKADTPQQRAELRASLDLSRTSLVLGRELKDQLPATLDDLARGIAHLPEGHTREVLTVLLDKTRRQMQAGDDALENYRQNLEGWFNQSMDRVSGWYKRWSQNISYIFATILVLACNVDSLQLAVRLMNDSAMRGALVSAASEVVELDKKAAMEAQKPAAASQNVADGEAANPGGAQVSSAVTDYIVKYVNNENVKLPLGWAEDENPLKMAGDWMSGKRPAAAQAGDKPQGAGEKAPNPAKAWRKPWHHDIWHVLGKIIGLSISIFAISLGAPFWFDLLGKVVNLRATGRKPDGQALTKTV